MRSISIIEKVKVMAKSPRAAQVTDAANVDSRICQENAQRGAKSAASAETKIISLRVVGPGTEMIPETEPTQSTHRVTKQGKAGAGIGDTRQRTQRTDPEVDPPPEVPTVLSLNSFQDPCTLNGRLPSRNFHERL